MTDPIRECWPWPGTINHDGYGVLVVGGRQVRAHRFIYERTHGKVPDGLTLDHLCRNRACVNPEHLEPVSTRENVLRGTGLSAENARKTHCKNGHQFTSKNTYLSVGRYGRVERRCRVCRNRELRERHAGEHWCSGSAGEDIYDPGTPCDAIRAADERDAARADRDDAWRRALAARDRYERAEADADRLAEALYTAAVAHHVNGEQSEHRWRAFDECQSDYCIEARAALRAHEEATK